MAYLTGAIHRLPPAFIPHLGQRARIDLIRPQKSCDWHKALPANGDAIGNDIAGNCVPAWDAQEEAIRLANSMGDTWRPTKQFVLDRYARLTGYNAATGANDNGTDTVADTGDLCTVGLRINDQLLDVPHWATLDPTNFEEMQIAISHFGAIAWTVNLPAAWQSLNWSVAPKDTPEWVPGSWDLSGTAYHRIGSGKFDGDFFTSRSWGLDLIVHPEALRRYLVAAEVRISRRWLEATGLAPSGLDFEQLTADSLKLSA